MNAATIQIWGRALNTFGMVIGITVPMVVGKLHLALVLETNGAV